MDRRTAESQLEQDANLLDFLRARARGASDARLALDVGIGLVAAIIGVVWRPTGWHIAVSAALCFMAFGVWGIADRELGERLGASARPSGGLRMLRAARLMSALLGALAGAALLVSLLGVALGTWIS